jgi:hypothetical protein
MVLYVLVGIRRRRGNYPESVALKRTERPCTFKLDGVVAGFANKEEVAVKGRL